MKSSYSKAKPGTELGLGRELLGLFSIFCGLLFVLSLVTFDSRDPWLNHVVSGVTRVHNKAGLLGSYLAGFFYDILGAGSWVLPALLCLAGARRVLGTGAWPWWRWFGFALLGLCISIAGAASDLGAVEIFAKGVLPKGAGNVSTHGGGIVGHMIYVSMVGWLSPTGAFLVWLFCLLLAMQMLTGLSWVGLLLAVGCALGRAVTEITQAVMDKRAERKAARRATAERETREALSLASEKTVAANAPRTRSRNAPLPAAETAPPASEEYALSFPTAAGSSAEDAESPFRTSGRTSGHATAPDQALGSNSASVFGTLTAEAVPGPPPTPGEAPSANGLQEQMPWPPAREKSLVQDQALFEALSDAPASRSAHPGDTEALASSASQPPQEAAGRLRLPSPDSEDEEADLPPWVRDFEEGRLGIPNLARETPIYAPDRSRDEETAGSVPEPTHFLPTDTARAQDSLSPAAVEELPPTLPGAFPQVAREQFSPAPHEEFVPAAHDELLRPAAATIQETAPGGVSVPRFLFSGSQSSRAALLRPEYASLPAQAQEQGERMPETAGHPDPLTPESTEFPDSLTPDSIAVLRARMPEPPRILGASATERPVPPGYYVGEADHGPQTLGQTPEREEEEQEPIPIYSAPPVHQASDKPAPGGGLLHALAGQLGKPRPAPLPPLDLLQAVPATVGATPRSVLEEKGRSLMTCLNDFGIQGEMVGIIPGPVVTMFEVRPAPGVRVSRIANLSDDLALALKAVAVRIQAPVPGTDTVGIEIPNAVRETVCLKELLGSEAFARSTSLLTLALGKDIAGHPAVADLATMPHLLVAGATGAGKSVGINSIILSLLYKARPEEVQLLLVDPKRVEMAIYADLPHLVHPVVTEMQLAKNALDWAVSEMEQRYNAIARAGVRNIADYNAKVLSWKDSPPDGLEDLETMPYLVIVIDELADLMLVAAKEVETSIVRLAQLARAAGIHLILATQRPSVDVVTGLIKANFPCRISFQVTSKHDSRTILDTVGAEHLLGKGDMLFKPGGGKFKRLHGAFVNDQNVNAVVDYWKSRQRPQYQVDFSDWAPEGSGVSISGGGGGGNGDIASDPMYNEAVEFVRQQGKASISLIQRKFRIGFNKAARFVEQMEQDGIIGPADGSKPRLVNR